MRRVFKGRPPRLTEVFRKDGWPLYFVTMNTLGRRPVLACSSVHDAWIAYAEKGVEFGVGVGRYVIMPDHIHAFVRIAPDMTLVRWGTGIKRFLGAALKNIGVAPTVCSHGGLKSNGNLVFLINFCVRPRAMRKNGRMYLRIRYGPDWLKMLRIGRIKVK